MAAGEHVVPGPARLVPCAAPARDAAAGGGAPGQGVAAAHPPRRRPRARRASPRRAGRPGSARSARTPSWSSGRRTSRRTSRPSRATWLMREAGSGTRDTCEALLAALDAEPPRLTLGSQGAVIAAAEAGLGVTLVSRQAVARQLADGRLAELPVPGHAAAPAVARREQPARHGGHRPVRRAPAGMPRAGLAPAPLRLCCHRPSAAQTVAPRISAVGTLTLIRVPEPGLRPHAERAADQLGPLGHAAHAVARAVPDGQLARALREVEAAAVVGDVEPGRGPPASRTASWTVVGPGVLLHVLQGLLGDAVERDLDVLGEPVLAEVQLAAQVGHRAAEAREAAREPEVVEDRRPEPADRDPGLVDGDVGQLTGERELLRRRRPGRSAACPPRRPGGSRG